MSEDKLVWITGASMGIGRATALELLSRGYRVALSARSLAALDEIAATWPGRAFAYPLDVTQRDAVAETVRAIEAAHGPIAIAFLNAGGHPHAKDSGPDIETIRATYDLNVFGLLYCVEALLPFFRARRAGRLSLVGSVAGYRGLPGAAAYCSSKAAVIALAESLRLDLRDEGITVQLVSPGFIRTPLTDRNKFPMPFLMPAEKAAIRIAESFASSGFETSFPRRFTFLMKLLRMAPYWLFMPVMERIPKNWRKG